MTGINEIRHYLLSELPLTIRNFWHSTGDALSSVSPYLYVTVIIALFIVTFSAVRIIAKVNRKERRKRRAVQKLSEAGSMQDYMSILTRYFKEDHPAMKSIGIYARDNDAYKLVNAESYEKETMDKSFFSGVITMPEPEHEIKGRYHIYTFAPSNRNVAVKIVSIDAIDFERLKTELEYLSALIENFTEKDHLKTELLKTRVMNEVKDIFSSPTFNMENYFTFIGNIILKAGNLDGVKIIFGDKRIIIGQHDIPEGRSRNLRVRSTDVNVEICRRNGVGQEDIIHVGRFLDLISAMLSFYWNRTLVGDFLYVLETAVKSFEDTGKYYQGHSGKVEFVALTIGEKLGLEPKSLEKLKYAARLHDIGMIGDIYDLTLKDLKLTDKDYSILKYHPLIGSTITAPTDSLNAISDIILQHHELNDGTGYPHGITADRILTESKILSMSEIFIGLISERPHRKAYGFEEAVRQISDLVPNKLDRDVFDAFMAAKNAIFAELREPI